MVNAFKSTVLILLLAANVSAYGRDLVVSVIDSGIDPTDNRVAPFICKKNGLINLTNVPMEKNANHGMHVAGIIINNSPPVGYCLRIIKVFDMVSPPEKNLQRIIRAMPHTKGAAITNISAGGSVFSEEEYNAMKLAKTLFILAAGNEDKDISQFPYFPASYRLGNSVVVGNLRRNGKKKAPSSNYGILVNVWEIGEFIKSFGLNGKNAIMSGTSMSTARHTARRLTQLLSK